MTSKNKSTRATTSRLYRVSILELACLVLIGAQPAAALQEAVGHVELAPAYTTATGAWTWKTHWFDDDLNTREDLVGTLFFPGWDKAPANQGVRNLRPPDAKWNFLSVNAGEPVWIFIDSSHASAGFSATQAGLSGDLVFKLDDVAGPAGGRFSMYSGSTPTIYMQTIDGISTADEFRKPSNHTHVNWAFSRKGLWIVRLTVQGTLSGSGTATTVSPAEPLVFAIGRYARWKASLFNQSELANHTISGDAADPDGDGMNNLTEYALGGHPKISSLVRVDDQQPLAPRLLPPSTPGSPWKFSYFRRTLSSEEAELTYDVKSSTSLANDSWSSETGAEEVLSAGVEWERVTVTLSNAPGGERNPVFFRLIIQLD